MEIIFLDSYGEPINHGDKIIIEHHYNYQHFNGKVAVVKWYQQKGMYRFYFKESSYGEDFNGVHSFKKVLNINNLT